MTAGTIAYDRAELAVLARLEPRHFWFRVRAAIIADALARWFPGARDYLEVGSGTGFVASRVREAWPGLRVVATDPLSDVPEIARLDITDIGCRAAFDVVGAYDVLEHLGDDRAALRQAALACRPGGGLLLTVPQHRWLWSPADERARHVRRYRRRDLVAALRATGGEVVGWSSFSTFALPLFLLRVLLLRGTGADPAARVPPGPLNALLGQAMQLERRLIGAGVRLPVGSSLLVAARRRAA